MNTMDPVVHHNPSQSTLTTVSSSRRRGSRENETPQQRLKREKAAERQRRKRERDRHVNNLNAAMSYQPTEQQSSPQAPSAQPDPPGFTGQELSPEEVARKERVRAAARERQRKHRSLVKQRKMRDMGLDVTGEMMPGMEEFRVNGEFPVLPPELAHPHPLNPADPSFPMVTGGQTFAATLMFSFAYTSVVKAQCLRTLSITPEELATLEPVIADAFDQWDHQRRLHYAQHAQAQAAAAKDGSMAGPSGPCPPPPTFAADIPDPVHAATGPAFGDQPPEPNDFRARFRSSLAVPPPFRNFSTAESTTATTSTPTSTPGSGPPSDPIDPHLSGVLGGDARQKDHEVDTVQT